MYSSNTRVSDLLYGPYDDERVSFETYTKSFYGNEHMFKVHVDIDSLLWIGNEFPDYFNEKLTIFPCPDPRRGIHRNIFVEFQGRSLSQIPNIEVATFSEFKICVFFPRLIRKSGSKIT